MARQQRHMREDEQPARVSLRMPEDLKRRLARLALDLGRSENALMVEALERYVETESAVQSDDQTAL